MIRMLLFVLAIPSGLYAQLPVTDAATNSQLIVLNKNILTLQAELTALNSNMTKMIYLMKKNVAVNSNASQSLSQELVSKRTAASFVVAAPEMAQIIRLKDKILEAYRSTNNNIKEFRHLQKEERKEANAFIEDLVLTLSSLMIQAKTMTSTPELIEPSARLTQIQTIVNRMENILNRMIAFNKELAQRNEHRESMHTVIKIN